MGCNMICENTERSTVYIVHLKVHCCIKKNLFKNFELKYYSNKVEIRETDSHTLIIKNVNV